MNKKRHTRFLTISEYNALSSGETLNIDPVVARSFKRSQVFPAFAPQFGTNPQILIGYDMIYED